MQPEHEAKPLPGPRDFDALLRFLPVFESPDFTFGAERGGGRREDGVFEMPYFSFSDQASRFVKTLHQHGFIRPFNWGQWQNQARRYIDEPSLIEQADLETICKLLTTHVRKDRFCDGHLAAMYDCGHLTALLKRTSQLRV